MRLIRLAGLPLVALLSVAGCNQTADAPAEPEAPALSAELEAGDAVQTDTADAAIPQSEAPNGDGLGGALPLFSNAVEFKAFCDQKLGELRAELDALEAFEGSPTIESFYTRSDRMRLNYYSGAALSSLYGNTYPDEEIRTAAEACQQDLTSLATDISLSRPIFDALSQIDATDADAATQYSLEKTIRDYKRSGVDKDEETRQRIRALIDEITVVGQEFGRNIRDDVRSLEIEPDKLTGLPEDYIAAHPPGENGLVTITTDYPDYVPFVTYAEDDAARKALRQLSRSRGYPQNETVLKSLIEKRDELAKLLGYESFAHYNLEDRMIGTPERAQQFIDEIAATVNNTAERDKSILLERLQQIDPQASEVGIWQYSYLRQLLKQEKYNVDTKLLRSYFPADQVKQGIFDLTSDLFGIEIRDWDAPVWEESVTAHEVLQDGKLIGRFYLDLYPREGKYKHAAHWGVRDGIDGVQLPISVLVCNFPGKDDPKALTEFGDVETFLHEFGHLLHHQFAGHGQWANNAGIATEHDFVEAPSQLLEEWAYDYETLRKFAINLDGETIPEGLVSQLSKSRFFGKGIETATQTFYAALSLAYYSRDPASFELLPLLKELQAEYSAFPYLEDTYFYANFGHLNGYSSGYYTYQWSLAIATDMFSRFEEGDMRDKDLSEAYRAAILDPGGSKPANELVEDFLGRPFTTEAYKAWLQRTE